MIWPTNSFAGSCSFEVCDLLREANSKTTSARTVVILTTIIRRITDAPGCSPVCGSGQVFPNKHRSGSSGIRKLVNALLKSALLDAAESTTASFVDCQLCNQLA